MRGLRRTRILAGIAAIALAATACGGGDNGGTTGQQPQESPAEGASGGEFSMYIGEPEHLVPGNTNETSGGEVLNALFTGLVEYDPETSEPVNAVASSIDSTDQKVWTITLNEGWTFHDGSPVDAQSFVDAWNWTAYSPNAAGNSYFFANIEGYDDLQAPTNDEGEPTGKPAAKEMTGLRAVDDQTIEVTLTAPFSQFPLTVGYTAFYPMPQAAFDDIKQYEQAPIGNGPYMMDGEWNHNESVNVVRYDDYAGEPGKADAIEFRIYSAIETAYNDLLAGNLDIMDSIPPEQLADAPNQFGDRFIQRASSLFTYVGFPLYDERFENVDLRRAFSMAIDRQAIIDAVFNGSFTPAKSVVSPVVAGAREDPCGENCTYNPEMAKQLFDQAGGYEGTLNLWFNSGAGHDVWMEAVSNQLRQNLGIQDIKFSQKEFAEYLAIADEEKFTGPFRLGWVMDYPSPQNYLEPIHGTGGSSNNTGFSNKQVDDLIAQGNAAGTIEEGITFYNQAEDLILQEMPIIPLWFGKVQGAHSENVSNVIIDAFTSVRTSEVVVTQ